MGRQSLKYAFGLIAIYLLANRASNGGTLITNGANGVATITKAFQGRQ